MSNSFSAPQVFTKTSRNLIGIVDFSRPGPARQQSCFECLARKTFKGSASDRFPVYPSRSCFSVGGEDNLNPLKEPGTGMHFLTLQFAAANLLPVPVSGILPYFTLDRCYKEEYE